jgi:hypothetical protein
VERGNGGGAHEAFVDAGHDGVNLPARLARRMMEQLVRILTAIFWVAAPVFVAMVVLSWVDYGLLVRLLGDGGVRFVSGVLVGVVLICSGLIAWYEFRANPLEEVSEYGEWTGRMTFYAIVFGITLFLSFFFLPAVFFAT